MELNPYEKIIAMQECGGGLGSLAVLTNEGRVLIVRPHHGTAVRWQDITPPNQAPSKN